MAVIDKTNLISILFFNSRGLDNANDGISGSRDESVGSLEALTNIKRDLDGLGEDIKAQKTFRNLEESQPTCQQPRRP